MAVPVIVVLRLSFCFQDTVCCQAQVCVELDFLFQMEKINMSHFILFICFRHENKLVSG